MRSVLITGVQGVGKSTIGRLAANTLGIQTWDYADLMLRVANDLRDKDEIGDLPWEKRCQIYAQVDGLLVEYFAPGDGRSECILLENHLSILDGHGIRTFSHDAIPQYNPVALVIVEAGPQEIIERRRTDTHRRRNLGTVEEITEQQTINQREASVISQRFSLPIAQIQNTNADLTGTKLAAWIAQILS
ncbi:MAG: AAA family ATPase [Pseudonocardiaceae bacterium]